MAAETLLISPKAFESLLIRARTALKAVLVQAGVDPHDLPGDLS